jgi:hypothetical protein
VCIKHANTNTYRPSDKVSTKTEMPVPFPIQFPKIIFIEDPFNSFQSCN